jgi:hypothetical protein
MSNPTTEILNNALATTTLFSVSNTGTTTIGLLGSGVVAANNGLLYSTASSTMFGTGTGGQVLTWNAGVPQWVATSTYTGSNGITTAFANNQLTITGTNAAADGATKGVAAFTAADFNDNGSGLLSIDYANGQTANSSQNGFLSSTDWTNFNNKVSSSSLVTSIAAAYPFQLTGNATSTLTQFNGGLTAYASSTIGNGFAGLTISGNSTTTGNAYVVGNIFIATSTPMSVSGVALASGNFYAPGAGGGYFFTNSTNTGLQNASVSDVRLLQGGTVMYRAAGNSASVPNLMVGSVNVTRGANTVFATINTGTATNSGIGSSTAMAKLSVHAVGSDTNQYLIALASS